jgi:hypothetical protein
MRFDGVIALFVVVGIVFPGAGLDARICGAVAPKMRRTIASQATGSKGP